MDVTSFPRFTGTGIWGIGSEWVGSELLDIVRDRDKDVGGPCCMFGGNEYVVGVDCLVKESDKEVGAFIKLMKV